MGAGRVRKPVIRLLSVASSCQSILKPLGCASAGNLVDLAQQAVGDAYRVTANERQIVAEEIDERGGRFDDVARAREIEATFADDDVAAAVALRGGAWLARILPLVDFDVLRRRTRRLALFGFSELTPLINIAATYPKIVAFYDVCPGSLLAAMTNHARAHAGEFSKRRLRDESAIEKFAKDWAAARFRDEFEAYFRDVRAIIEGRGSSRSIVGQCVRGSIRWPRSITVVGGNLTAMVPLLGSPYAKALRPKGRWLAIEDIRELPERIDRLLAHFTLSGWLKQYEGILLGTFYRAEGDVTEAALACLDRHLGRHGPPVVATPFVGHTWPISPLPIARPFDLCPIKHGAGRMSVELVIPWARFRVV